MTKEELKRRLYSYRDLKEESKQVSEKLAEIRSRMTSPRGAGSDGLPHSSGSGDPMFGMVSRCMELEQRYRSLNEKLIQSQTEIEELIDQLGSKERRLLRYHYIDGLTMEQAGERMGYVERHAHRVHASALRHLLEKCHGMSPS